MQAFDHLNSVIQQLGQRNQIANITLAADGSFGLQLVSGTEVSGELQDDVLYLYGIVAPLPLQSAQRQKIFEILLEANCLGIGTAGGVLSIHQGNQSIIYHLALLPESLDVSTLELALHSVAEHCESYLAVINQRLSQAPSPASDIRFVPPAMLIPV